jgi:hypothetical protein
MSSMEHPHHSGWAHSVEPEYAILVLLAVLAVGLAMTLPW